MNKRAYIFYLIIFVVGFSISYLCGYKMGTSDLKNVAIKSDAVKANNENKKEGYWLIAKDNILYVYKSDKETEIAETDINISNMSLKDRKIFMLKALRNCLNFSRQTPVDERTINENNCYWCRSIRSCGSDSCC